MRWRGRWHSDRSNTSLYTWASASPGLVWIRRIPTLSSPQVAGGAKEGTAGGGAESAASLVAAIPACFPQGLPDAARSRNAATSAASEVGADVAGMSAVIAEGRRAREG